MPRPLVTHPDRIRLAMLGMVEGNGHPYSWSAIINGRYDAQRMAACGYPVIPQYLGAQPPDTLGIPGAAVTHVWCDRRDDAQQVAACCYIKHVLERPEDALGHVDAVIIATDIGGEHVHRARPFIEAGLPVFIDKPLTDRQDHLRLFVTWVDEGKAILSTSAMRYACEFVELRSRLAEVGHPRYIVVSMAKTWERYGIHAIEAVYGLLAPGQWTGVTNSGTPERNVVHASHADGVEVVWLVGQDMLGAFAHVTVYGTKGRIDARFDDTFAAFKAQLQAFVTYLRCGERPFPFAQTVEQMKIVIAGIRSRDAHGRKIALEEIAV